MPLKNSGPQNSIAPISSASKNSCQKGLTSELLVAKYFIDRGYEITSQRLRTPFAEIDLVVTSPFEVLLVEVKSLSDHDWLAFRVGERQKMRLKRALIFMQTKFARPVRFHLATVTKGGEIEILPDFLS